jgi:3-methyladenine DNA glycosylase AlkD
MQYTEILEKLRSLANQKAIEWGELAEEFFRRAGFVLMVQLAVPNKKADDRQFEQFFPIIKREASDGSYFVKRAINWALRQIGEKTPTVNKIAIEVAKEIRQMDSKAGHWIADDALRE